MESLLVEAEGLEHLVGRVEDGAAGGLIDAARLHADEPVLEQIDNADAVRAADLIELFDEGHTVHLDAVEAHRHALFKAEGDIGRLVGRLHRRDAHLEDLVELRLVCRILEVEALVAQMPEVLVLAVVGLLGDRNRNVVLRGVLDLVLTALELPGAPRGDDGHVGRKGLNGQLKADLVVALAGAAVGDGVSPLGLGDLDNALGDDRPRKGGAEQILVLIDGARLERREHKVVDKFALEILDVELRRAGLDGFLLEAVQLLALPDIGGDRYDFTVVVVLLEPRNDDRGVKAARVGENHFFNLFFLVVHDKIPRIVFRLVPLYAREEGFARVFLNKYSYLCNFIRLYKSSSRPVMFSVISHKIGQGVSLSGRNFQLFFPWKPCMILVYCHTGEFILPVCVFNSKISQSEGMTNGK